MKRLLLATWDFLSSWVLFLLVIGFFLFLYIGIAFVNDDSLIALMDLTRTNIFLTILFILLPISIFVRIVSETCLHFTRRKALLGNEHDISPKLFDETVELSKCPSFAELQDRLGATGYSTRLNDTILAAWRGVSSYSPRILFLVGMFCLFTGIFISLNTRTSYRGTVIEGEPFPATSGDGGIVEKIILDKSPGLILSKNLLIEVDPSGSGEEKKKFELYPPSRYRGAFVYPRYLGIGLFFRFSAPDVPIPYEKHSILSIYPPGKEASEEIPGSPYRIIFTLAELNDGNDPYMMKHRTILFKLLKGKDIILSGSAPSGGEFSQDGYNISFPDSRRLVITDFIQDSGVFLIWISSILFIVSLSVWLLIRVLFPRREMLFRLESDKIQAYSRTEGRSRKHTGIFHKALDSLETARHDTR